MGMLAVAGRRGRRTRSWDVGCAREDDGMRALTAARALVSRLRGRWMGRASYGRRQRGGLPAVGSGRRYAVTRGFYLGPRPPPAEALAAVSDSAPAVTLIDRRPTAYGHPACAPAVNGPPQVRCVVRLS